MWIFEIKFIDSESDKINSKVIWYLFLDLIEWYYSLVTKIIGFLHKIDI